jgi:hypothetical protein
VDALVNVSATSDDTASGADDSLLAWTADAVFDSAGDLGAGLCLVVGHFLDQLAHANAKLAVTEAEFHAETTSA